MRTRTVDSAPIAAAISCGPIAAAIDGGWRPGCSTGRAGDAQSEMAMIWSSALVTQLTPFQLTNLAKSGDHLDFDEASIR